MYVMSTLKMPQMAQALERAGYILLGFLPGYDRDGRPIIVVRGFRIEHVFDQSQTEQIPGAQQLPEPRPWVAQRGQGPAGLWDAICALITAAGYEIEPRPPVGAGRRRCLPGR